MFLSDLSIRRPIMMSMFLLVFILFGGLAFWGMPLDLTPDVDIPYVTVQTIYSGAGPEEIEMQLTKKIEDAVSSISQIDQMISYSMEGVSLVIIKFELDKDVDVANQEVKDKVDAILNDLPDDSEDPIVEKINLQEFPIVDLVLSGDLSPTELWDLADKKLSDRFSQIEGVARAEISGGQEREIQIVLDDKAVFQSNITLQQLSQILSASNLDMPGGHFELSTQEYTVRLEGEFESVQELADQEIPTIGGNRRIRDIADVEDTGIEVRERASYFNNLDKIGSDDVVLISIVKNSEGNTVEIAQAVSEMLPEVEAGLPAGCQLNVVTDKSLFIESTVSDTISNILLGILFTGIVLLIFLHDVRSTIIVALAMPMSIISAFVFMDMAGYTKNILTLMALSTSVGILVANSVVVIENIFRHKRQGKDRKEAASVGTSEVVVAVLASTATNIAVFLPIATMSGMVGQFFEAFALTVTFATVFSLVMSFTLTPMLASLILSEGSKGKWGIGEKIESWIRSMESFYRRLLAAVLKNRKRSAMVLIGGIALFVFTMAFAGGLGFEFAPMMDEGDIRIEVELPLGYNLDETAEELKMIETRVKQDPSVKHILTQIGKISEVDQGTYLATMNIKLIDVNDRSLSTDETASKFVDALSDIPNAMIRVRAVSSMDMGGQSPITFNLMGQDIDELESYKEQTIELIKDVPGLVNLNTSSRTGKPEISIIPDRKKISDAGLTIYEIAMQLRGALTGLVATQYRDQGEEYDVRVLIEDSSLDTPEQVANLSIFSNGKAYSLSQLADFEFSSGISRVLHIDKYKSVQFTGSPASGVPLGDVTGEIERRVAEIDLPNGYKFDWGGTAEMMNDAIAEMLQALIIALILTYMLLAAILEDLRQPLLVLGTFPLALIGVVGGMLLTGATMNIVSMMAIVMLLGIVVNNAILILDYANTLIREKGMGVRKALLEACPVKLRPILMSSIAVMLGMLPMAMGLGASGREMREPMGIVSIGGLAVSTILTLVVIPALYNLVTKRKETAVTDNIE